jgi:hypothetical protein
MSTKGMHYYLSRLESDAIASQTQNIEDVKLVLTANNISIEEGPAELHRSAVLKFRQPSPSGQVETILRAKILQ